MPDQDRRGMMNYVNRNSGPPAGRPINVKDLVVNVPKTKAAPNTRQPGNNLHGQNVQPGGQVTPQQPFRTHNSDTIGASSIAPSAESEPNVAIDSQYVTTNDHAMVDDELDDAELDEAGSGDNDSDDGLPPQHQTSQFNGQFLDPRLMHLMEHTDRKLKQESMTSNLPYMDGDSYPETTSGNPSVVDQNDDQTHPHQDDHMTKKTVQTTAQTTHPRPSKSPRNVPAAPGPPPDRQAPNVHPKSANAKFQAPLRDEVDVRPSPQAVPAKSAHRDSRPATKDASGSLSHRAQTTDVALAQEVPQPMQPVQPVQSLPPQLKTQAKPTVGPTILNGNANSKQYPNMDTSIPNGTPLKSSTQKPRNKSEDLVLDYPLPDLYQMSYDDLKAQSFDSDPNDTSSKRKRAKDNGTIHGQLGALAQSGADDQGRFFASLTIDEWEDAGEWFITQFGEVLSKLKDARKEKRDAARLFENEIERRYKAVTKQRKQTEDALNGMKASGDKVLQGTPKKAKMR